MKQKYSTIFFDWSGAIADDTGDQFIWQMFKNVGASDDQIPEIICNHFNRLMIGQISESELWNCLKNEYGLHTPLSASGEFKKWHGLVANEEILNYVKKLKQAGYQVAVLSNIVEPVYEIIKSMGYYDMFDEAIVSCKVGYMKPQKEIYYLALDMLETTAHQSILIDDKQLNLDSAKEIGFETILAENSGQIIRDIQKAIDQHPS